MNDPIPTKLLDQFTVTPSELQDILRAGRRSVYAALKSGEIKSMRVGSSIRVSTAYLRQRLGISEAV